VIDARCIFAKAEEFRLFSESCLSITCRGRVQRFAMGIIVNHSPLKESDSDTWTLNVWPDTLLECAKRVSDGALPSCAMKCPDVGFKSKRRDRASRGSMESCILTKTYIVIYMLYICYINLLYLIIYNHLAPLMDALDFCGSYIILRIEFLI